MFGSAAERRIVARPLPMANSILSGPGFALANVIASRSVQVPVPVTAHPDAWSVSLASLTTMVAARPIAGPRQSSSASPLRARTPNLTDGLRLPPDRSVPLRVHLDHSGRGQPRARYRAIIVTGYLSSPSSARAIAARTASARRGASEAV